MIGRLNLAQSSTFNRFARGMLKPLYLMLYARPICRFTLGAYRAYPLLVVRSANGSAAAPGTGAQNPTVLRSVRGRVFLGGAAGVGAGSHPLLRGFAPSLPD